MKKFLGILISNVILLLILTGCFEIYYYNRYNERVGDWRTLKDFYASDMLRFPYSERFEAVPEHPSGKAPVLMIGCSFTYGQWLDPNDNVSAKLSKLTGRRVYNTGVIGSDPIKQLQFFHTEANNPQIKEKPQYIIYTYMFHHIDRWDDWEIYNVLRKENMIASQPYNFLYRSYTYKYLKNVLYDKLIFNKGGGENSTYELFIEIVRKLKEISLGMYPDSKFVVLLYDDINYDLSDELKNDPERMRQLFDILYSDKLRKDLENIGATVISTEELIGRKMDKKEDRIPSDIDVNHPHPSSSARDEILPALVNKLGL